MFREDIGDFTYSFEINGKYACIKKIERKYGITIEKRSIEKINIPSEVHFNNYTYIVNSISGEETTDYTYEAITTDRRRKDYGKSVCTGKYTSINGMLWELEHYELMNWGCEIILPKTIREIELGAFRRDTRGAVNPKVVLNDGIKIIRTGAFYQCNVDDLIIPSSLKTIEYGGFLDCAEPIKLIIDNEPGAVKIHELALCKPEGISHREMRKSKSEIVYLRPKTSLFAKLIKKLS